MLRQLPNLISIIRIILVWPVVEGLLEGDYEMAWWLFLIAGISDGVDGYLARRFNWRTELGAMLDPIGDKLLMVCSYLVLGWLAQLPLWLVALVIIRDVVIVVGTLVYQRITGDKVIQPLYVSKVNTVVQILLVVAVIYSLAFWVLPGVLIQILIFLTAVTTIVSGTSYVVVWSRKIRDTKSGRQA
ncbi:MAG: CDP-alcohol phosphatidyltransferase family protein [Thioalkalispiraceae bacterium]|jgi:cardiolipin synthase